MTEFDPIHHLIYLDRDYVSGIYEVITGSPSMTQITKTEGKKAGAGIPVFSAEISAGETRTFSVSTTAMLKEVMPKLSKLPSLPTTGINTEGHSEVGWIEGQMSVFMVNVTRHEKTLASEKYFGIHRADGLKIALIATPEYFSSGLGSFTALYETVLEDHKFNVRALVRALPACTGFDERIAVPLVITEADRLSSL